MVTYLKHFDLIAISDDIHECVGLMPVAVLPYGPNVILESVPTDRRPIDFGIVIAAHPCGDKSLIVRLPIAQVIAAFDLRHLHGLSTWIVWNRRGRFHCLVDRGHQQSRFIPSAPIRHTCEIYLETREVENGCVAFLHEPSTEPARKELLIAQRHGYKVTAAIFAVID